MTSSALPKGWRIVKFGDVAENMNETTKDPLSIGLERVVGLDHMDPESLPLKRWDNYSDLHEGTSFTRVFRAGQVLFGKRRAYQRKVSLAGFDGICSGDILVFQPKNDELLSGFLPYIVQSDGFFEHALGTSAGSLSPRTKWQELAKYEFALPSLSDQKRLIKLISASDAAINDRELLKHENFIRTILFNHLYSAEMSWEKVPLCDLFSRSIGGVWGSDPGLDQHDVLVLRSVEFNENGSLNYLTGVRRSIGAAQLASRQLTEGDILLEKSGGGPDQPVGRVAFVDSDLLDQSVCSNFIQLLTPKQELVVPYFVFLVMWFLYTKNATLEFQTATTGIRNLRTSDYLGQEIPLPSIKDQHRIVDLVRSVQSLASDNERSLSALRAIRHNFVNNLSQNGLPNV